jgi:ATP-dependent RNA helicase DeaD
MSTFYELGVTKDFVKGLKELGIKHPTEIQEATISALLKSATDFIGLAQTGTGKTAAYGLPLLQNIDADSTEVQALILSPTRELAQQIKKQLFKFTKYIEPKIFVEAIYGGEKIEKQQKALRRTTHIIVATPGRLIDLMERGEVDLQNIKTLVIDEADEILSMGFKQDLNRILRYTGRHKKTWLFSATFPTEIQKIVKTYMSPKALRVEVNKNMLINDNITHKYIKTSIKGKLHLLAKLLDKRAGERGIIFCRTKASTRNATSFLKEEGFSVAALEGDMQQREREKVMRAFKKGALPLLVATDVAARGIDVINLSFIIHYQLPEKIDYYTHRSGRTARAGKKGTSIALIIPNELQKIHEIQKALNIQFTEINR